MSGYTKDQNILSEKKEKERKKKERERPVGTHGSVYLWTRGHTHLNIELRQTATVLNKHTSVCKFINIYIYILLKNYIFT